MKECEWCGDDFRGRAEELEGHFFCSMECLMEWKKDVYGSAEEPGGQEAQTAEASGTEGED